MKNGYFAVDDVALIYATSVQRLTLKRKKNGFSLNLPTQFDDPHFLFQLLNGYIVLYLLV